MQFLKLQSLFADFQIFFHRAKPVVYGRYQAVVHRNRHVGSKESRLAGILEAAHSGKIGVGFDRSGIQRGKCVNELTEGAEIFFKGLPAHPNVPAFPINAEVAVRQRDVLPVLVLHGGEGHVYAFQHVEHVGAVARNVRQHGKHFFLLLGEHVTAAPQDAVDHVRVGFEVRRFQVA